jgi:hypothetical protein
MSPPAACVQVSASYAAWEIRAGEEEGLGRYCGTVSATEIVSLRSLSKVATSSTMWRSSVGGNGDVILA